MSTALPRTGRLAGVDFGTVRIGIAISDAGQTLASPLDNYQRGSPQQDARYFQQLVADEGIVGFVVGLPIHLSGDESPKSRQAREFGRWLENVSGLPVDFYDERLSSTIADDFLAEGRLTRKQRQKRRDMLAAQVILANYIEAGLRTRSGDRQDG